MNYSEINYCDLANGEGIRISLFVSGCKFHCPGCFNQEAQRFSYGKEFTYEQTNMIEEALKDSKIDGISFLGGDPMWQSNLYLVVMGHLADVAHALGKNVWLWTGFTWEELTQTPKTVPQIRRQDLLRKCDVLIDGPFVKEKKDLSLAWRGSSNQRVIDVQKSLKEGEVILYEGNA